MNSVLSTLADTIERQSVPVDQYLQQIKGHQMINPFQYPGNLRIGDELPDEFWGEKGIRRIVADHVHFGPAVADPGTVLGGCSLVEMADWTELTDNSSWDKLYSKLIKPLKKRDFQFIFHLGDVAYKPVFGIDEVLDVIGDYSSCGQVTLMLDVHEADTLWCRLNGRNADAVQSGNGSPTAKDRYLFIFNTMSIDFLVVLQAGHAMQFSREGQANVSGLLPVSIGGVINARVRFSAGYQLGLLLQLDALHCTALGLAVSGVYARLSSGTGSLPLVEHIRSWLTSFN
jgi:hypothetical protein